jgi:glycosyltransferase involved in cell wall biosynthesis
MEAKERSRSGIELSLVIPVYNAAQSIGPLVQKIMTIFHSIKHEIVLVNDGSQDKSRSVCLDLSAHHPDIVLFIDLARNFGEQHAVLAGLNYSSGKYVAVLDDDGQNPPEEVVRMLEELTTKNFDVVYGHYIQKQHHWFRNLGSRFNDRMATIMLGKPRDLYLSSFKVMSRFIVDEIIKYRGTFPYIDGLIYRATTNLGQIRVQHLSAVQASRYTFEKLIKLWFNMFIGFSITPLRISAIVGMCMSIFSVFLIFAIIIDKLFITRVLTLGVPTMLATTTFFAGIQLMILGLVGEYLGRLFLDNSGTPQFVIRSVHGNQRPPLT